MSNSLVLWVIMKKSVPLFTRNQRGLDRLAQITNENLEGARVVRAFQSRDKERARFDGAADAMRIASFITLIIFLFLKQRPKNGRRS